MALMGIGWVKVKMLPFDNKSNSRSSSTCPKAARWKTRAVRAVNRRRRRVEPEVTDYEIYAGVSSPFSFNGLVRHYFMRRGANIADVQVNLVQGRRRAQSHDIAKRVRPRVTEIARYGAAGRRRRSAAARPCCKRWLLKSTDRTKRAVSRWRTRLSSFQKTPGVVDTIGISRRSAEGAISD
jgi:hypothetical protein